MFLKEISKSTKHTRKSKLGTEHTYHREKRFVCLRCDSCSREFERPRESMSPKRINNNYFHVCKDCDVKKFAQKMGVTRKKIWDLPASSGLDISKL
jgi:hypothetical protein